MMPYNHKKIFVNNKNNMYFVNCPDKFSVSYSQLITNQVLVNDNIEYTLSIYDFISIIKYYINKNYFIKSLYFSNMLDYKCTELYKFINKRITSGRDIDNLINLLERASEVDIFGVKLLELESEENLLYIGVDGDFGVKNNPDKESLLIIDILCNKKEALQ